MHRKDLGVWMVVVMGRRCESLCSRPNGFLYLSTGLGLVRRRAGGRERICDPLLIGPRSSILGCSGTLSRSHVLLRRVSDRRYKVQWRRKRKSRYWWLNKDVDRIESGGELVEVIVTTN